MHSRDCDVLEEKQFQRGPLAHDVFAHDAIACMVLSWEGLGRSRARAAISNLALRGVQRGCRTLCRWWLLGAALFQKLRERHAASWFASVLLGVQSVCKGEC